MNFQMLQGTEKLQQVTQLLDSLESDLKEKSLTSQQRVQTLLQLRQHGTSPVNAGPIYSKKGIEILMKYGVDGDTADVRRAALRCVANALLLDEKMRQVFVDTGYGGRLAENIKCDISEDEMVASRILFFSTYNTNMDFEKLINDHALATNVIYQISRHAKQFPESGKAALSQMDELALTDTLKLIFNVSKIYSHLAEAFLPTIPDILTIISRADIPSKPLDGMVGFLVNCLSILDIDSENVKHLESSLFQTSNQNMNVDRLINLLDRAVSAYNPSELEIKVVPLIYGLIIIYEAAPDDSRKHMKQLLLPEADDRSQPIGHSDDLPSKLLKSINTPYQNLKTAISELMFVLSERDSENLTKNIGYGFAAGFLASRGMEVPKMAGEEEDSGGLDPAINPITGQRWSAEPSDPGPPMTKEEKEREAERLFVLFERARATGVLNVENPVRQAVETGRLEELPDSDEDSD